MTGIPEQGICARNLQCIRDDRILFEKLDFDLEAGAVLQIEGHNGSGKTSLLRILCGLSRPAEGTVYWNGLDIEKNPDEYRIELNYIGHAAGVKADLSPLENLEISRNLNGLGRPGLAPEEALRLIGLRGFEDIPARTLSAGQQRRVALARLLIRQCRLWILDEPFTSIDKHGIRQIEELLDAHIESGGLAILTSHHPVQCKQVNSIHLT